MKSKTLLLGNKMTNNLYVIKLCLCEETLNKVHLYMQDNDSVNTKQNHIYRGWFLNFDLKTPKEFS
jgi:hypothetical protein